MRRCACGRPLDLALRRAACVVCTKAPQRKTQNRKPFTGAWRSVRVGIVEQVSRRRHRA